MNLDEVWALAYKEKGKAVRALRTNELFVDGIDYQVFTPNGQKTDGVFAQNGKKSDDAQDDGRNVGGRPQNTYMLSVPCLEFFIARKVRPVFEVYRQVFHKVASGGISLGNQVFQSVPMGLEETLAPLARYHAMIEDRFDIVRGALTNAGIDDGGVNEHGSLTYAANACRNEYKAYRTYISQLVYVETSFKLEGPSAFSLYDY